MTNETFTSAGKTYNMTINPAPTDGKKYPVIFLIHGNAGLVAPFGDQIHGFAKDLADRGYLTAVPQYYTDNNSYFEDTTPHNQILADAIEAIAARQDADLDRLGLIGFSLGATTAMTYIASNPQGTVKVLADFFGFLTPLIEAGVAKFPPTIILHNKNDKIVLVRNSEKLDKLLEKANIEHTFKVYDEHWKMMYDGHLVEVNHSSSSRAARPMLTHGSKRRTASSVTYPLQANSTFHNAKELFMNLKISIIALLSSPRLLPKLQLPQTRPRQSSITLACVMLPQPSLSGPLCLPSPTTKNRTARLGSISQAGMLFIHDSVWRRISDLSNVASSSDAEMPGAKRCARPTAF